VIPGLFNIAVYSLQRPCAATFHAFFTIGAAGMGEINQWIAIIITTDNELRAGINAVITAAAFRAKRRFTARPWRTDLQYPVTDITAQEISSRR
jgi:hypothetical protein